MVLTVESRVTTFFPAGIWFHARKNACVNSLVDEKNPRDTKLANVAVGLCCKKSSLLFIRAPKVLTSVHEYFKPFSFCLENMTKRKIKTK